MTEPRVDPTFCYTDVSADPQAPALTNISERTRSELAELGFERLGHVCAESSSCWLLSEVWRSSDGRVLASINSSNTGDVPSFKCLLADGTVVVPETRQPGMLGWVIAHGVPAPPSSGYHWASRRHSDLRELL